MNIIITHNKELDRLLEATIRSLRKKYTIDFGVIVGNASYNPNRCKEKNIEYFDSWDLGAQNLPMLENYKPNHALPRNILNGMLPYKTMALLLATRETHYEIYDFKYLEDLYYKHLTFCYDFLTDKNIDFILFMGPTHHMGGYIMYALSGLLGIGKIIIYPVIDYGLNLIGSSIETCGENVEQEYKKLLDNSSSFDNYELTERFTKLYRNMTQEKTLFSVDEMQRIREITIKELCYFIRPYNIVRRVVKMLVIPFMRKYRENISFYMKEQVRLWKLTVKALLQELSMDHISDYDKHAIDPDYGKKYIFFALQQTPEETTMPRAGEYRNQFLSIQTLSKAVEGSDIEIYVKEHFVQPHRDKGFYKKIAYLPNVKLIRADISSRELIKNSIAVSSQTGTCILEAALNCKNTLYFAEGMPFKGLPGAVLVKDEMHARNEIEAIMNGKRSISVTDGLRYVKALEKSIILYSNKMLDEEVDVNATKIVNFIDKYYRSKNVENVRTLN